jgi:ferredoxin-NADP reductase/MOSC domain-containing protein YiiM/ferredoxin
MTTVHHRAAATERDQQPLAETRAAGTRSVAGRLLSVNVGLPREVEWQGKTVYTGIWKEPVDARRMVRRLNVDGDGQGDLQGHGGEHRAVFVYQIQSYDYWQRYLRRDDFTYGQFGENFTVDGLADDEVHIGDRYRIGDAVFEVTQPRVTCYRIGMRMREPEMPSLLVAHHRPGFYFRVIEEGEVAAGDEIEQIASGPEQMTVAEIDALLYLPHRSSRSLARALRIPALSAGWQGSFRDLLEQADQAKTTADTSTTQLWPGFRQLRVAEIDAESTSVMSLRLVATGDVPATAPLPGQFVTLRLRPDPASPPLLRCYSLSALPDRVSYRISVEREPSGAGSQYLCTKVAVGDELEVAAPRGSFVLEPGDSPVVLISAGVGATPVLAMLHTLADQNAARQVWWLHGARNHREHAFADEVDGLLASLPDAHRVVCYSRPDTDPATDPRFDLAGRMSASTLERAGVPSDADAYLCGPESFMHDLGAALIARGAAPERIRTERFASADALRPGVVHQAERPPHPPAGRTGTGPMVSFGRSGLNVPWDPDFASLLELAEACDVPVRFSCRTGVCHTCETGVLSGNTTYKPEPLEPPAQGNVLICCSTPKTELVLDL